MPKSKEFVASDSDSASDSEDEKPKKKLKTEKKKKEKKPKDSDSESGDEPDDDGMMELGKMKFVKVSEFKGNSYVNIREYYEKDGKTLPGKKGIALNVSQWKKLKKNMGRIDKMLENM